MIYTVTLNPSLDRTLGVSELHPGELHRARFIREDLGGKGINVSRCLHTLGIPSIIMGFSGGRSGEALQTGLLAEGFDISFVNISAEIRNNITLFDESNGKYTKINEHGPEINAHHITEIEELVRCNAMPGDLWAFCGSLPSAAPVDLYARLIQVVQERQGLAFLDTSGAALRAGLSAYPFAVKINTDEAYELFNENLEGESELLSLAGQLQKGNTHLVAITRGAKGLVLISDNTRLVATSPEVEAHSPVGAGDATLAGFLWAISENCDPITVARRAVACGTAAAMQAGSSVGELSDFHRLMPEIEIRLC